MVVNSSRDACFNKIGKYYLKSKQKKNKKKSKWEAILEKSQRHTGIKEKPQKVYGLERAKRLGAI